MRTLRYAAAASALVLMLAPLAASAAATTTAANSQTRIATAISRADQEIARRTAALNDALARIEAMTRVSDSEKASFNTSVNAQISTLASLKAKIDADTDMPTLKTDIQSITASYRIYMLVLPQVRIAAAADRIETTAATFSTVESKLQQRIASASGDTSALSSALSDMNAQIVDAQAQASAANSETASLVPDNGNASVAASNKASLVDARGKLKTALADLTAARKDAGTIVSGLKALESASTASTTGQ